MINRELYMDKIRGFMHQPELIKIITGIRRSGKSVMLALIQAELRANGISKSNILAYNFEDMSLSNFKDPHVLHGHLKSSIDNRVPSEKS